MQAALSSSIDSTLVPELAMQQGPGRLMSLDALRGFDMFWIIGGDELVRSLAKYFDTPFWHQMAAHTEHPEWNGFTFYDLIFPLFMFIAGAAMPYSLLAKLEQGEPKSRLYVRVIRRGLLLVLLGVIYNGGLRFSFVRQRYPSVLGRIGLGYMFAGLIVLNTNVRGRILWAIGILVGYWAAMKYIPVPGIGAGNWEPGMTLADFIDRSVLPGRLYRTVRDPEGLFSTIPSIATVLIGCLAGGWLRKPTPGGVAKALGLMLAGAVGLGLGKLWDGSLGYFSFPINKNLWTSSFVLWTSGWSLLALAIFYLVIDVWRFRRWAFVFVVIGMNAITIYLLQEFVDFNKLSTIVFTSNHVHKLIFENSALILKWLLLFMLYRAKIFLRV